jgi:3-phosphoshikimate 1-carboxyvinyltransferase
MAFQIMAPQNKIVEGNVKIPLSKSESSRVLFIHALLDNMLGDTHYADASDTQTLKKLLQSNAETLDAGDGGTTARFILAYCVAKKRNAIVTGSERLKQRTIKPSVDVLRQLGASVDYLDHDGFLPVKINATNLVVPKEIFADASQSSQHISACMLIAPLLNSEITIHLSEITASMPYLALTADVMKQFGAAVTMVSGKIIIGNKKYRLHDVKTTGDWSAASYFYEIAALSHSAELILENLNRNSLQGDKIIADMMLPFGVTSNFEDQRIIIKKGNHIVPEYFSAHFFNTPDIALTLAATCGGLNVKADLFELNNLLIKESDRVSAFQREAYKLNIKTDFCGGSKLKILEASAIKQSARILKSYNDHRMVMCLTPLCLITNDVFMDSMDAVKKSFPDFNLSLTNLGFKIIEIK